jgi:hypothetical protein
MPLKKKKQRYVTGRMTDVIVRVAICLREPLTT